MRLCMRHGSREGDCERRVRCLEETVNRAACAACAACAVCEGRARFFDFLAQGNVYTPLATLLPVNKHQHSDRDRDRVTTCAETFFRPHRRPRTQQKDETIGRG